MEAVADSLFFFGFLSGVAIEAGFPGFSIDFAVNGDLALFGFSNLHGTWLASGVFYVSFPTDHPVKIAARYQPSDVFSAGNTDIHHNDRFLSG